MHNNVFFICKLSCHPHHILERLNTLCGGSEMTDALSGIRKTIVGDKKTAKQIQTQPGISDFFHQLKEGKGLTTPD